MAFWKKEEEIEDKEEEEQFRNGCFLLGSGVP